MGVTVQEGWPDTLEHRCSHCGDGVLRLLGVELRHAARLIAICQPCAGALSRVLVSFHEEAQ